jgi:hypothetical protein
MPNVFLQQASLLQGLGIRHEIGDSKENTGSDSNSVKSAVKESVGNLSRKLNSREGHYERPGLLESLLFLTLRTVGLLGFVHHPVF